MTAGLSIASSPEAEGDPVDWMGLAALIRRASPEMADAGINSEPRTHHWADQWGVAEHGPTSA